MSYGVVPEGFARKPANVILRDLEDENITEFGTGLLQTAQTPMGQINGLSALAIGEIWELGLAIYQMMDVDSSEGNALDVIAKLRGVSRGEMEDEDFRKAISNAGKARIDIQDLILSVKELEGVEFVAAYANEGKVVDSNGLDPATVSVAAIGGDDEEIANAIRKNIASGVGTYGNHTITSRIGGYCRGFAIVRPLPVKVAINVNVSLKKTIGNCPPPSLLSIKQKIISSWVTDRKNGLTPDWYYIRRSIESSYAGVEVKSVEIDRGDSTQTIGFLEIAEISEDELIISEVTTEVSDE